ncbi:hypothetical protein I3760_13G161100 [Carya illinoinensis]|nr:hypothetical protein I3760_13G161100 [Carya illinoinensis]
MRHTVYDQASHGNQNISNFHSIWHLALYSSTEASSLISFR